jgi:hypothetical protein
VGALTTARPRHVAGRVPRRWAGMGREVPARGAMSEPTGYTALLGEICQLERGTCGEVGMQAVADEYGGEPAVPRDVADTMAKTSYQPHAWAAAF